MSQENPYLNGRQSGQPQKAPSNIPYESVLVGYFCQAVGWIIRDSVDRMPQSMSREQRIAKAINLSHNPLDPAVGDLILHLDASKTKPAEFFVFELKREWAYGLQDERRKFRAKNNDDDVDVSFVKSLLKKFPRAFTAHFYGALREHSATDSRKSHVLCTAPYWQSLTNVSADLSLILIQLNKIVSGACIGHGFQFDELSKYIAELNKNAASGSMAESGSTRFAVAYQDQQLYAFDLDTVLELRKTRQFYRTVENTMTPRKPGKSLGR